jgi:hypothetical protein
MDASVCTAAHQHAVLIVHHTAYGLGSVPSAPKALRHSQALQNAEPSKAAVSLQAHRQLSIETFEAPPMASSTNSTSLSLSRPMRYCGVGPTYFRTSHAAEMRDFPNFRPVDCSACRYDGVYTMTQSSTMSPDTSTDAAVMPDDTYAPTAKAKRRLLADEDEDEDSDAKGPFIRLASRKLFPGRRLPFAAHLPRDSHLPRLARGFIVLLGLRR